MLSQPLVCLWIIDLKQGDVCIFCSISILRRVSTKWFTTCHTHLDAPRSWCSLIYFLFDILRFLFRYLRKTKTLRTVLLATQIFNLIIRFCLTLNLDVFLTFFFLPKYLILSWFVFTPCRCCCLSFLGHERENRLRHFSMCSCRKRCVNTPRSVRK